MGGGSCEGVCVSVSREAELRRERKNASAGVKRDIILLILLTRALWFSITPPSSYLSFPFSCFSEFSFHNQVAGPQHLPCWHKTQSGDASRGSVKKNFFHLNLIHSATLLLGPHFALDLL